MLNEQKQAVEANHIIWYRGSVLGRRLPPGSATCGSAYGMAAAQSPCISGNTRPEAATDIPNPEGCHATENYTTGSQSMDKWSVRSPMQFSRPRSKVAAPAAFDTGQTDD